MQFIWVHHQLDFWINGAQAFRSSKGFEFSALGIGVGVQGLPLQVRKLDDVAVH